MRLGRPIFLAVELPAGGFGELVEPFGFEQFIEPSVEGVGGRGRQLLLGDPRYLLPDPLPPCSQRHTQFYAETFSASIDFSRRADLNHGLLGERLHRLATEGGQQYPNQEEHQTQEQADADGAGSPGKLFPYQQSA